MYEKKDCCSMSDRPFVNSLVLAYAFLREGASALFLLVHGV